MEQSKETKQESLSENPVPENKETETKTGTESEVQSQTEATKKKSKPNFSKPFIISGILLGLFAGAPLLNVGNYIFGLWGWVFGLLAAWFLSKEYKYFQLTHGGMVGFLTGIIGAVIAMGLDIGLCFTGISTYQLLPVLKKVSATMGFWIPAQFHEAIILTPWTQIQESYRIALNSGQSAISPTKILAGHAMFLIPLLAFTSILGGIIGWKLFAKEAPKRAYTPRRKRVIGTDKAVVATKKESTTDSESANNNDTSSKTKN